MRLTKFTIALASFSVLTAPAFAQANSLTRDPAQVQSGTYVLDASHGKITWSLSHLGFSTYAGQFSDVRARLTLDARKPTQSTLEASVNMASAGTLNSMLDAHLKTADFFDVEKYPTARFQATSISLIDQNSAEITGNLTLKGVTRPIVMTADFNQAGINPVDQKYRLGFDGRAIIKRSDFGINYALPILGDEVTLHMEAEFIMDNQPDTQAKK